MHTRSSESVLHVHRAERADLLVEALAEVVRAPLPDPMQAEIVAVPTRGVERWLAQSLSAVTGASPGREDGVCANVDFPFPGRLVGEAVAAVSGVERDVDPWPPERSMWPLLEVVEDALDEEWLAFLAAYLRAGADGEQASARRLGAVRHLADLYDRYAVHRPAMVRDWARGEDDRWQARLWRRLRARIDSPSPAERLEGACARLRDAPDAVSLPARLSVFGLTRLPASYLDVLRALAAGRDVHLFLLHPSLALWERTAAFLASHPPVRLRAGDPTAELVEHPLLASWGRDAREMQLVLESGDGVRGDPRPLAVGGATLLARLQAAVRANEAPPGAPLTGREDARPLLDEGDRSLQVHACHGRARQVEVVRDAILHLLAADRTLEPRDVIVMCPDIEAFAPHVHATFGAAVGEVPLDLRVRLADRSLRQTNPLLGVVAELLELAPGRLAASQVLDLAGREPLRRRFGFDDDELATLARWTAASGVRWGLDAAARAPYKVERIEANTWRAGWDRVLVGVAMAEEEQRLVGGVLPLDDVASGDIDLAGRFAELLDRLGEVMRVLAVPHTVEGWAHELARAADLLAGTREADAWQRLQLGRLLEDVVAEADGSEAELGLAELRALLADRLRGRPTRASFRTGHLTICSLVPMRSVPHRVVCLMGLDDGAFPRQPARDGDDLLIEEPHVGDRDPRSEDRQLLLDALLAAREHLVVTYAGRDERTNLERPPAVPLGELLDVIDGSVRTPDGRPARERVVVEHPLQPFDARNFIPGRLMPGEPWSYDRVNLAGAEAAVSPRPRPPFLAAPLAPAALERIELDELLRFLKHPAKAFLRQRLGVGAGTRDDELEDELPVELDGLERWSIGDRLLEALLDGADAQACLAAEDARGAFPPGALGRKVRADLLAGAQAIVAVARAEGLVGAPDSVDLSVALPDGREVVGTVSQIYGDAVGAASFSRLAPKHRLPAWARLLALAAAEPHRLAQAVTVGRIRDGGDPEASVSVARLRLPDAAEERRASALEQLRLLVDLYERNLREPLPIYCETSAAYAAAVRAGRDAEAAAARQWRSTFDWPQEDAEAEHVLVLGGRRPFAELLTVEPREDEQGDGWADQDQSRFGRYAHRLWDGLLAHEEIRDR